MAAKKVKVATKSVEAGGKVITAKNGKKYVQTKDGKVKKVSDLSDIRKLDLVLITDYKKMTVDLHRFIRDKEVGNKLSTVTYKNGSVLFRKFKINYSAKGLTIIDIGNFSKEVKHGLGAFPTAEEVYNFVKVNKVDKKQIERAKAERNAKTQDLIKRVLREIKPGNIQKMTTKNAKALYEQLKSETNIKDDLKKSYMDKLVKKYTYLLPRETDVVNELRKKALVICKREKKVEKLIQKLRLFIPNRSFNVFFGKLKNKLREGEIRTATFREELVKLIQNDEIFAEKKQVAPKFVIKPIIHIDEIVEQTDEYVTIRNNSGDFTYSKSEILLRDVLYMESRYHVAIHKYLKGEITIEQLRKNPILRDKYVCLDYNDLKGYNSELYEWAEDVLFEYSNPNPLDIIYRNELMLNVGDKLVIKFPGSFQKLKGTVIKYENGWKVRYEDGSVEYLYKGQIIKVVNVCQQ